MQPQRMTIDAAMTLKSQLLADIQHNAAVSIDLSQCEKMDLSGVQLLLAGMHESRQCGCTLTLKGHLTAEVQSALELMGGFSQSPQTGEELESFFMTVVEHSCG
ncbi:MAG: STAS domain-containing protein [Spirochaetales bacterium]|nr:STAS domain-containing protein [Spirochaetales bacterium]